MKKILFLALVLFICTSFINYPCHPNGDIGPCTHRLHVTDTGACSHFDYYGNRIHSFDYYPCGHPTHIAGDVYPCTHYCY
jgi:hypothetical protein